MLTLHTFELDENSYRVRLLLALFGVDYRPAAVNMFPGREHLGPGIRALSPAGRMPVLETENLVLSGPVAALCYIAREFDSQSRWLPLEAHAFAHVMHWLSFSETVLAPAVEARLDALFETAGKGATHVASARRALRIMDDHMAIRRLERAHWFVGDDPTIADIALFPSFALSRDYGVDHDEFPDLSRWARQIRRLNGFITMPGIPDYA